MEHAKIVKEANKAFECTFEPDLIAKKNSNLDETIRDVDTFYED